tara:strand:+ start:326 stop:553 length:228 start_codon:yes stop_codon:yes gene_type:complete
MTKPIHMRFYDTSFMDFDMDHEGYTAAMLAMTKVRKPEHIATGRAFLKKYAAKDGHVHQALCKECLSHIEASLAK